MLNKVLFTIGSFQVTIIVIVLAFLVLALFIGVLAFRANYILQVKLSRLMDAESATHNADGFVVLLKKRKKQILTASRQVSPAMVVVQLDNLGTLYVGYKNQKYLMRKIAGIFTEGLTDVEMSSRIDFNKFALILSNRNREEVKDYILKLNRRLNELEFENYGLYTFFITCAVYEAVPLENPKRELDLTVYTLKYATIKDGFIYYYSQEVYDKVKQLELINSLKEVALENGQYVPYVQPKVDFRSGRVKGGEVLVRWVDGDGNIIYRPDEFVPLFELNGFIRYIDLKMFEDSCAILQTLKNAGHGDIILSTNFSKLTLNSIRTTEKLIETCKRYNVEPNQLEIEITETEFMESATTFSNSLMKLRQAGFRISMDDFGKEYSSLSLLIDNRFDTIKVDKFFFETSLATEKEKNVVKNIINLLVSVGCHIVLEGIETVQTLDYLAYVWRDLWLQGYYFSKPIPPSKFEAFVDTVFEFNYPDKVNEDDDDKTKKIVVEANANDGSNGNAGSNTSINISTGGTTNNNAEVDSLKEQMENMRREMERQMAEQREAAHKKDMEMMNQQIEAMRRQNEEALEAQRRAAEAQRMALEAQRNQPAVVETQIVNQNDEEVRRLRRELDDERYERERERQRHERELEDAARNRDRDRYRDRDDYRDRRDYDDLQQQIRDLRNERNQQPQVVQQQQPPMYGYPYPPYPYPGYPYPYPGYQQQPQQNINVDDIISRLQKSQQETVNDAVKRAKMDAQKDNDALRDTLEEERKKREELEATLREMQEAQVKAYEEAVEQAKAQQEVEEIVDAEIIAKEQEEADENLNLDLDCLGDDDTPDVDEDDDEEDDEDGDADSDDAAEKSAKSSKPELSLAEIEALIANYQDKFKDEWNQHAQEELKDGYDKLLEAMKFYKNNPQMPEEKLNFVDKVKRLQPEVKQLFNIIKNELMKYDGITNRLTNSYDVFYKGRNQVAKLAFSKTKVRLYLAMDPNEEKFAKFPHKDLSQKKAHAKTPYYTMLKSQLSVKRAQRVIAKMMEDLGLQENKGYKAVDYATKYKFFKHDQKK